MIIKKEYKDFSATLHERHSLEPIVVQIELTYACPLRCVHCYTDCYNTIEFRKKELTTKDFKRIIDKLYNAKCLWLCFTGGDPMMRKDFLELYDYAKKKGFLLTIFTSLATLPDEILEKFKSHPPFSIEMTLNGATEETYEKISRVKGSFNKVMKNIERVIKAKLPLKIKTLLSTNNIHEKERLERLINSFGLDFIPSTMIFARLNGDPSPCQYRLSIDEVIKLEGVYDDTECPVKNSTNSFFRCAIGTWQYHIDFLGRLHLCSCVREPNFDVLSGDLMKGVKILSHFVNNKRFETDSKCKDCNIWHICNWCSGKAFLEMGDWERPISYFCELAHRQVRVNNEIKIT